MAKTYYEVLGVDKNATSDEIKKAFHKLARKHHPDAGGDEETFKEINEAYSVLSDPEKRKQYDEFGQYGMPGGAYGGAGGRPGGTWTYTTGVGGNFNWDDILKDFGGFGGGGASWSDIFGGRGGQRQQAPAKGRDLQSTLEVTFEEAFSGTTKKIKLKNPDSGETEEVLVKVPAGAVDGGKLRYKHKGGYAPGDGERGDLLIVTKILPHEVFERKNADVLMTLPVTPAEAALGAKVTVPLPDGGKVKIKVPAGMQNGKVLVLSGKGAPKVKGKGNGDLKITLQIAVPSSITAQQKKAYENLAAADEASQVSVRPQIDAAISV